MTTLPLQKHKDTSDGPRRGEKWDIRLGFQKSRKQTISWSTEVPHTLRSSKTVTIQFQFQRIANLTLRACSQYLCIPQINAEQKFYKLCDNGQPRMSSLASASSAILLTGRLTPSCCEISPRVAAGSASSCSTNELIDSEAQMNL